MLRTASGLLVPDDVVTRRREVWPREEWKQIDRAAKLLNGYRVLTLMRCGLPDCGSPIIEALEQPGGVTLRCGCTDRILTDKGRTGG